LRTLYNAALLPVLVASLVFGAWPRGSPEADLERDQRLARGLPSVPPEAVWIHGASVGEARMVGALAREIRRRRPAQPLAVSAVTPTGRAQLPAPPDVEGAFFLPLDFPAVQRRAFDHLRPAMIVLIETELWPNLLNEAAKRAVPVAIVNGRLSPKRLARYKRFSALYRPLLRARHGRRRERRRRGALLPRAPERAIHVTGNLKFDLPRAASNVADLRLRFGLPAGRPVVIAGSTGEGEDALVLDAFLNARRLVPSLLIILAPRHPERFESAAAEASRRGLTVARVSAGRANPGADVLLVDTIGQLASLYGLAGSAFVGGSLVPVGGHNLLEPLAAGVPVLFGPHTDHVAQIAEALLAAGAGIRVDDAFALSRHWAELATRPEETARIASAGAAFLAANRGALQRAVDLVLQIRDAA
jgi:3-deoxy-D-manno-octulosonic-acid transferase